MAAAGPGLKIRFTCERANMRTRGVRPCSRVRPVKNRDLHCDWQLRPALRPVLRPVKNRGLHCGWQLQLALCPVKNRDSHCGWQLRPALRPVLRPVLREHANRGEHPLFACSLLCPAEKTEPRRVPRRIATFWWQPTHAARAETACGLCRARRRKTSVAKLKAPKPSACRFRGNNLRPALSGRSKLRPLQPPAPGTRAFGCSFSAPSENAAVETRFQGRS